MEKYYLAKRAGDLRPGEKFMLEINSKVFLCEHVHINSVEGSAVIDKLSVQLDANDTILVYDEDKDGAKETIDVKEFLQNIQKVITSTIKKKKPLFVNEESSKRFTDMLRTWRQEAENAL